MFPLLPQVKTSKIEFLNQHVTLFPMVNFFLSLLAVSHAYILIFYGKSLFFPLKLEMYILLPTTFHVGIWKFLYTIPKNVKFRNRKDILWIEAGIYSWVKKGNMTGRQKSILTSRCSNLLDVHTYCKLYYIMENY
jgi:hypothetical protein